MDIRFDFPHFLCHLNSCHLRHFHIAYHHIGQPEPEKLQRFFRMIAIIDLKYLRKLFLKQILQAVGYNRLIIHHKQCVFFLLTHPGSPLPGNTFRLQLYMQGYPQPSQAGTVHLQRILFFKKDL